MSKARDYYQILHVQPDAPGEIIRSSYRAIMQKMRLHPDLGGDGEEAAIVNEAYATLKNPQQRAAYDRSRGILERPGTSGNALQAPPRVSSPALHRCAFCGCVNEGEAGDPSAEFCCECLSPLFLTRQYPMEDDGRRSIARLSSDCPLIFCTHWPQSKACSGRTIDISLKGMSFHSSVDLSVGQVIKIDTQIHRAVARVTRSRRQSDGWEVGVQFMTLHFEQARGSFVADHA